MLKTRFLLFLIILIGLSACSQGLPIGATPTSSSDTGGFVLATSTPFALSGIEGNVTKGPACPGPVRIGATECQDQPYQANISILDENNNQSTQFQTDNMGYFKISLDPGTYILHPEPGNPLPTAADQTVVVVDGQFTQVSISYDTGIR
jgi:hypothetical protein